jgi:hypothetical protein
MIYCLFDDMVFQWLPYKIVQVGFESDWIRKQDYGSGSKRTTMLKTEEWEYTVLML